MPQGLGLQGLQFDYHTPRTFSANLTLQYSLTRTLSAQVAYVFTDGNNLQTGVGNNNVTSTLAGRYKPTQPIRMVNSHSRISAQGQLPVQRSETSIYNGLQTKLEQQFSNGLNFLFTYTWSKTLSDAGDLLNGGSLNGFRAPDVPGLGPSFDWGLADFDIRNVFHFSGGYELPFGKDKHFLQPGKVDECSGWRLERQLDRRRFRAASRSLSVAQPATTSGTNCNDVKVPGQSQKLGLHHRLSNGKTDSGLGIRRPSSSLARWGLTVRYRPSDAYL